MKRLGGFKGEYDFAFSFPDSESNLLVLRNRVRNVVEGMVVRNDDRWEECDLRKQTNLDTAEVLAGMGDA